mgnify:CR=1 FL=1
MGGIEPKTSNSSTEVIGTPFWKLKKSKYSPFRYLRLIEISRQMKHLSQSNFSLKEGGCASTFVEQIAPIHTWMIDLYFKDYLLLCLHVCHHPLESFFLIYRS